MTSCQPLFRAPTSRPRRMRPVTVAQLKANPDYWKGKPHISNIDVKYVSSSDRGQPGRERAARHGPARICRQTTSSGSKRTRTSRHTSCLNSALSTWAAGRRGAVEERPPAPGGDVRHRPSGHHPRRPEGIGHADQHRPAEHQLGLSANGQGINHCNRTIRPRPRRSFRPTGTRWVSDGYFQKNGQDLGFTISIPQGTSRTPKSQI